MKSVWKRWLVRGVKLVLVLVILFFVGWQFKRDLAQLDFAEIQLRPGWLLATGALYLLGLFPGVWFWRHLLANFGYPLSLYAAVRAHYIGQLGKYVPGKALAVAMRSDLVHPSGVPYGVSIIATFYEVFTGMASGAIVAALVYMIEPPTFSEIPLAAGLRWHPVWIGVVLMSMCGIPLLPGVFNLLIAKLTAKIQAIELYRLPPIRFGTLAAGLLTTCLGWWLQGLSVWAMLQAAMPNPPEWTWSTWAQCTAAIAFANVAGFVILVAPGGLGVREYLLRMLLSSFGPGQYIAASAIMLRLVWIGAEVFIAACTYWCKPAGKGSEPAGSDPS